MENVENCAYDNYSPVLRDLQNCHGWCQVYCHAKLSNLKADSG